MSQTINIQENLPLWMINTVRPNNSFELEIQNKISPFPHYPGPIHSLGGLLIPGPTLGRPELGQHCRVPGVQPLTQTILRPKTCIPHCLTTFCFDYGNTTRFPPSCECNDIKRNCRPYTKCNHNSNVIFQ